MPFSVAIDSNDNLYVADLFNSRIRRWYYYVVAGTDTQANSDSGLATTSTSISGRKGVFVDSYDNIYIADTNNNKIRKVTAADGICTTIAGAGAAGAFGDCIDAASATIDIPVGVAVDSSGNVYIADSNNHKIKKLTPVTPVPTVVPTDVPTVVPTVLPTTGVPSVAPTKARRHNQGKKPTKAPTKKPSAAPTRKNKHDHDKHHTKEHVKSILSTSTVSQWIFFNRL